MSNASVELLATDLNPQGGVFCPSPKADMKIWNSHPKVYLDVAKTGQATGWMADVLAISKQNPKEVAKLLNQSVSLPITLMSRLLNTRIGEAVLQRLAKVIYPLKASQDGVVALRSAVILGLANGNGSINAISFLQAYPVPEIEVSIPALMAMLKKASSIAELVRFFSESPLDGLKPAP